MLSRADNTLLVRSASFDDGGDPFCVAPALLKKIELTVKFWPLWSDGQLRDLMRSKGGQLTLHFFFSLVGADPVGPIYERSAFVDLVTVLLAQAPRLAILNSFLLGIVSSSRAINTRHNRRNRT